MMPTGLLNVKSEPQEVSEGHPVSTTPPTVEPPPEPIVTVFCGKLVARLHLRYFQCPGIHHPCIEIDNEMITPTELCYRANKDKQKDWKGSIRAGKFTLRRLMETKTIDFYNHAEVCSTKCHSRRSQFDKSDPSIPMPMYPVPLTFNPSGPIPYGLPPLQLPASYPFQLQNPMGLPMAGIFQDPARSSMARGYQDKEQQENGCMSPKQLLHTMDTDPLTFWNEISRLGMMPEILQVVGHRLDNICATAADETAHLGYMAPPLSRLTHALNLQAHIISRIRDHQSNNFPGLDYQPPQMESEIVADQEELFNDHPVQQENTMILVKEEPEWFSRPLEGEPTRPLKRLQSLRRQVACKKMALDFDLE